MREGLTIYFVGLSFVPIRASEKNRRQPTEKFPANKSAELPSYFPLFGIFAPRITGKWKQVRRWLKIVTDYSKIAQDYFQIVLDYSKIVLDYFQIIADYFKIVGSYFRRIWDDL